MRPPDDALRWGGGLVATIAAALVVPFALAGSAVDRWFDSYREHATASVALAAVLAALLVADVVAPIPSSVVCSVAGVAFGPIAGGVLVFAALGISCAIGFALAGRLARPMGRSPLGARTLAKVSRLDGREATWAIVLSRPVPLVAEATVIAAGLGGVTRRRFMVACAAGNAAVATLFAALPGVLS